VTNVVVLPDDLSAAEAARHHVAEELARQSVDDEVADDAILVASELAANAVRHGRPPVTLALEYRDGRVRISVHDSGHGTDPRSPAPSTTSGSGRGLAIVRDIAVDHGWDRDDDGLTVWAELELRSRPTP
jgi:anti-sigma regulatory factor (Ser/Thr protein kinase)